VVDFGCEQFGTAFISRRVYRLRCTTDVECPRSRPWPWNGAVLQRVETVDGAILSEAERSPWRFVTSIQRCIPTAGRHADPVAGRTQPNAPDEGIRKTRTLAADRAGPRQSHQAHCAPSAEGARRAGSGLGLLSHRRWQRPGSRPAI
jgi:hypothetical protein